LRASKVIPSWQYGDGWYQRLNWTEEEFDARLRDFYAGMFRRYAAEQGKPRWGEKTPFHTSHVIEMARLFPSAVFIGIVRHPGAVAASLRKGFHYTFRDALTYWRATNLDMVRSATQLGNRFVLVRYEDLLAHGEPVLRELMAWLGEEWSPRLLEHHRVQQEKGAPRVVDGSTSTREPIDMDRADRWLRTATEDDYRALDDTASLAAFFGYTSADPTVRKQLTSVGVTRRWLPNGDDLHARCRSWTEKIDFDDRPTAIPIDANLQDLADRLSRAEQALARTRTRRLVRWGDAFRKVQRGRSLQAAREAWALARGPRG
jgi:hypothetical protein